MILATTSTARVGQIRKTDNDLFYIVTEVCSDFVCVMWFDTLDSSILSHNYFNPTQDHTIIVNIRDEV
jgi:hypothetical protein